MAIDITEAFQHLVVGGGAAAGTWFAVKRMVRGDRAQDVSAKIDVVAQEGLLKELQHWQTLALEVAPLRSKLAHDEARIVSLSIMLQTVRKLLCTDCKTNNADLIRYIENEMNQLVPVRRETHEPTNPLDNEVRAAVEQFMVSQYKANPR